MALVKFDLNLLFSQLFSLLLRNSFLRWKIASKTKYQHCCNSVVFPVILLLILCGEHTSTPQLSLPAFLLADETFSRKSFLSIQNQHLL